MTVRAGDPPAWDDALRPRIRLDEVLARAAREHPEREAIVDDERRLTFRELDLEVTALAEALRSDGVAPGGRVATAITTGHRAPLALYAISRAGAVAVPINEYWTATEVGDALERSRAEHVLTDEALGGPSGAVAAALDALPADARPTWLLIDGEGALRRRADGTLRHGETDDPAVAVLLFTSGSTAKPKGALVPHHGLVGVAHYFALAGGLTAEDRFLHLMPLYHVGGISEGLLPMHLAGGVCVMLRYDVERALEVFARERITATCAFDSMLETMQKAPGYSRDRHPFWRMAGISGSARTYDNLHAAGVRDVAAGYGMTEFSGDLTFSRPWQREEDRRGSVGIPLPGIELRIVDPVTREVCPPGVTGEIEADGWNRFLGYIDDPTGNDDPFFPTGDLGRLGPGGTVIYEGRTKHMIKSGGENVAAFEVESFLVTEIEAIESAVVVGVPDDTWGEMVVAFVSFRDASGLPTDELRRRCKEKLAGFKVPKRFFVVDRASWPLMAAGKIDRARLEALARDRVAGVGDALSVDG